MRRPALPVRAEKPLTSFRPAGKRLPFDVDRKWGEWKQMDEAASTGQTDTRPGR